MYFSEYTLIIKHCMTVLEIYFHNFLKIIFQKSSESMVHFLLEMDTHIMHKKVSNKY